MTQHIDGLPNCVCVWITRVLCHVWLINRLAITGGGGAEDVKGALFAAVTDTCRQYKAHLVRS